MRWAQLPALVLLGVIVISIVAVAWRALELGKDQTATTLIGYAVAMSGGFALGRRSKDK